MALHCWGGGGGTAHAGEDQQQRSQVQGATRKTTEPLAAMQVLHCSAYVKDLRFWDKSWKCAT